MLVLTSFFLYAIRILIIGTAIGTIFIRYNVFRKISCKVVMVIGIASTPMIVSLIDYLLGFVFIGWSSWFYYVIPMMIAIIWLLSLQNYKIVATVYKGILDDLTKQAHQLGKWLIFDSFVVGSILICFVFLFCIKPTFFSFGSEVIHNLNLMGYCVGLFFIICVCAIFFYFIKLMIKDGTASKNFFFIVLLTMVCSSLYMGCSLNRRPVIDHDRSHYELDARYFAEDKNSWEVDNYSDERYGSSLRDDHGSLWIMYLSDAHILADMLGLENPLRTTNVAIMWAYICFYILLFISALIITGTKRAGVISLCMFCLYQDEIGMLLGGRDAFRFVGLLLLMLYVGNIFFDIVENKTKWHQYLFMFLFCFLSMQGHEGNVYIMLGMFVFVGVALLCYRTPIKQIICCGCAVLLGTLFGITKTISIYLETEKLSSSTLTPFYGTPVVEAYKKYMSARADWAAIWASYTKPVLFMMVLGLIGLGVLLIVAWRGKKRETYIYGLIMAGMLLPLTKVMDWMGYECSRWFVEQGRYRMYFLMLFAITGSWLLTYLFGRKYLRYVSSIILLGCFIAYIHVESIRCTIYTREYMKSTEDIVDACEKLGEIVDEVTEGSVFTDNQVLLYYLHGTPKLLFHQYSEELIQAKTEEEIASAIENLNVGAIILPASGYEFHDYSLLPFWEYIHNEDEFGMITAEDRGDSFNLVIFYNKSKTRESNR